MTRTISVGELRQNPTTALNEVADGARIIVLRNKRPIADLVPHTPVHGVSGAEAMARIRAAALTVDADFIADLTDARLAAERDPWS